MEKGFQLKLCDKSDVLIGMLMLSPSKTDNVTKKCDGKKGIVYSYDT